MNSGLNIGRQILFLALMAVSSPASAQSFTPAAFFNFEGHLTDSGGNPVTDNSVVFTLSIMDHSGNCILYQEQHTVDMSASGGGFNLAVGKGSRVGDDPGLTVTRVFDNSQTSSGLTCASGTSYTPASGDSRQLKVTVSAPSISGSPESLPMVSIGSSPSALMCESVQGLDRGKLAEFGTHLHTNMTAANLLKLFNGTDAGSLHHHDGRYARLNNSQSINLGTQQTLGLGRFTSAEEAALSLNTTTDVGKMWINSDTGKIMYWDGMAAVEVASGGGTAVTSIFGRSGTVTAQAGDYNASQITNTANGNISATNVQAAINELDAEKVATTRNVNAGTGLTGGGDLSSDRTLSIDITGTTAETTADDNDEILIYDSSASAIRKMTRADFLSGVGGGADNMGDHVATTNIELGPNYLTGDASTNKGIFIDVDGNVGVGDSHNAPDALVHLLKSGSAAKLKIESNSVPITRMKNSGATAGGRVWDMRVNSLGRFQISLLADDESSVAAEPFTIRSDGNVGIGTTNPLAKLHVNGPASINGNIFYWNAPGDDNWRTRVIDDNSLMTRTLVTNNALTFTSANASNQGIVFGPSGGAAAFEISGERVAYFSERVGIGTIPSAGSKLHVAGQIHAQEICDIDGNNCQDLSAGGGGGADDLGNHTATTALNMSNQKIVNLSDPTGNQDAATKLYADTLVTNLDAGNILSGTLAATRLPAFGGDITSTAGSSTLTINNNVVSTTHISDGAVTTAKIQDGTITDADISPSAAISDTKLATITAAGKVANSATTADTLNVPNSIVMRNASGDFASGSISSSGSISAVGSISANSFSGSGIGLTGLNASNIGTGTLLVSRGGTGRTNFTANSIMTVDGSGNPTGGMTCPTGQVLASNGAGWTCSSAGGGSGDFSTDGSLPMTGSFKASAGTESSPSITFNADPNTGFFNAGADIIGVSTGGLQRMTVGSSGNVGIGTTNPTEKLEVVGNMKVEGTMKVTSDVTFLKDDGSPSTVRHETYDSGNMTVAPTYLLRRARGTATTSSPVFNNDTLGYIGFDGKGTSGFGTAAIIRTTVDDVPSANMVPGRIEFMTTPAGSPSPATRMTVKNDGRVGIGTTIPSAKLTVAGAIVNAQPYDAGGTPFTIDFSQSNIAFSSASCGAFTLNNLVNGGSYTLIVQGATANTCTFSAAGLMFRLPPDHGNTTPGTHTIYNFMVVGTNVYVSWAPGYN